MENSSNETPWSHKFLSESIKNLFNKSENLTYNHEISFKILWKSGPKIE
jgi:hypothetical protein